MGFKDRVGRCYELSFQEMRRGAWDYLAHGYLHYMGACIHHAWVERAGAVYDPVWDVEVPRDVYYRMFDAQDVTLYTPKQVCEQALLTGVYGPWQQIDMSRLKLLSADVPRRRMTYAAP